MWWKKYSFFTEAEGPGYSQWLYKPRATGLDLEEFLIPLEEINRATKNFSPETRIRDNGFAMVYKGQLSERWDNRTAAIKRLGKKTCQEKDEFLHELKMISRLHHPNIIRFLGYCDQGNEMIIVYEYAINGSLYLHLCDPDKIGCITWAQRLKICLRAAIGFDYLHSGLRKDYSVRVRSSYILLDDNMDAKIGDYGLSELYTDVAGSNSYVNDNLLYSFGVVMFEMWSGMGCYQKKSFGDGEPQYLTDFIRLLAPRYFIVDRLRNLIDPSMIYHIDIPSSDIFIETAYQCISSDKEKCPTMGTVIERIKGALIKHEQRDASTINIQSRMFSSGLNLRTFLIPLEEINRATKNFSPETQIGDGGFGMVYKGQLSKRWQNRTAAIKRLGQKINQEKDEFLHEVKMISRFHHQNIIPFLGYCDKGNEMIIVFEYAINGSLDVHLEDPDKIGCITWAQRLKICLGAATGLNYLHSGLGEDNRVIHRDVKSANIFLDENMEAKIGDFGLSRLGPRNQPHTQLYTKVAGTHFYLDPIYNASDILRKESDVYSFGVVMFEMLSGMPAYQERNFGYGEPQYLISRVRRLADSSVDRLNELIDPNMKDHIDFPSSDIFIQIAYNCISLDVNKRPTMGTVIERIKEALKNHEQRDASTINIQSHQYQSTVSSSGLNLENFLIPLAEIKQATKNFSSTKIGASGFCNIYKGQLSERWQNRMAAFKRFYQKNGPGGEEFRNELKLISTFHHQNIISFIGYCVEDDEIIIVLEYAINGSLDHYLGDANKNRCLTWAQRLKICLGAASGLNYLHSDLKGNNRVIHVDPKSSNIWLDHNMEAKVCEFGFSIVIPQNQSHIKAYPAGTANYLDPISLDICIIGEHSDVYTFGVVLFEILSGMLARESNISLGDDEGHRLIHLVRHYYDDGLEKLIDPCIRDHIVIASFETLKEIAYQCISLNLTERPTMNRIIEGIKKALNIQETGPALLNCLMEKIGFIEGKPVAAFTIYKCLLHWKSFEAEQTTVFDRLIYMFDSAIEKEDTNDNMAYWLSNISALLFLIHGSVKLNEESLMGFHVSPSSVSVVEAAAAIEVVQAVGKHTALSFKQKLTEYVEYTYDIICDNLIKELGWLLTLCIQAPRTPRRVPKAENSVVKDSESNHWQGIVDCLNTLLNTLRKNFVPPIIVGKIFTQLFSYINIQVFHSILLYRECCTFSNGKYVEAGLKALQQWCRQTKEEYVSSAMEKLMNLRQAVTLLVIMNERYAKKSFVEISEDICPCLSLQQLYRICSLYRDENNDIPSVTQHVISSIEKRRKDFKNEDINSFILQDYSSERFSIGDLVTSPPVKDFAGIKPPAKLAKYSALRFLFD